MIALLCLHACANQLELEPAQNISEDLSLSDDNNVKAVLIGAYDALGSIHLHGGICLRNSELLGGDGELIWVGTFTWVKDIFLKQMTPTNLDAANLWLEAYRAINICNNVLSALEVVKSEDRDRIEGEALFIRSTIYFELVRYFGKPFEAGADNTQLGVPIILTPTRSITENDEVPRNAVKEVYELVISDLNKAKELLPSENGWRVSSWAATALLSRVYLQMGAFSEARDASNQVIEVGQYSLLSNYANVFNRDDNSSEDIFAIQVTPQDGTNAMNLFFSIPEFGGRDGDVEILQGHLGLYDSTDARLSLFYFGNGAMRSGKWNNQFGNISILRLAEMYLNRAECNFRLGAIPEALADYNATRTRAGLLPAMNVTLDEILLERRKELAHEGFRIHDIKRLGHSVGNLAFDACPLVFPVPERELNANPNLEDLCY